MSKPKPTKADQKIYRQIMRRFEPDFFYEKNRFSPEGEAAQKWRLLWIGEKLCVVTALMAMFFAYWPVVPILVFVLFLSSVYRQHLTDVKANPDFHEKRANDPDYDTEGRILEGCAVLVVGFICLIWFVGVVTEW